jgi:hypothetical protein
MRLLNNSQQVRSQFVISLTFIYQGELSGFMQNSQVFFVKFYKHWVEVRNNRGFWDLRAPPQPFCCSYFIYQGELGGFMQNFQVFLVKVCQDCVEVRNRNGFGILGAIENYALSQNPAGN